MNPKALLAAILVVVLAGGVFLYSYLNGDQAEEASVNAALGGDAEGAGPAADSATDSATEGTAETPPAAGLTDATGTWVVSTEIGTFDVLEASSTFVGFRVNEELTNVGAIEAVGRTPAVSGQMTIDGTTVTGTSIEADFTAMDSDRATRVSQITRAMGVDTNPVGTFVLTMPVNFGAIPAPGALVTFQAAGDLTVNAITQPITLDMEASVDDGNIIVAGSAPVVFADFDIVAPKVGPVVSVEQEGTIEVQVWFVRS